MGSISYPVQEYIYRIDKGVRPTDDRPRRRSYESRGRPFVAWDGEGVTDERGHHYQLFGSSDGEVVMGAELTWRETFPLLLASQEDAIHVGFALVYDTVMMLRGHPEIQRIMQGQRTYVDEYNIQYFRGKWLHIKSRITGRSMRLYDVFSFFQCSFVKACREYLGEHPALGLLSIVLGLLLANAPRWMALVLGAWWLLLACAAWRLQKAGRCVDTYQAIWGPDAVHPGNAKTPIGWGVCRPVTLTPGRENSRNSRLI